MGSLRFLYFLYCILFVGPLRQLVTRLARLNRQLSFLLCYVAMIACLSGCQEQLFSWAGVVASLLAR
jgi:hypothetical protein